MSPSPTTYSSTRRAALGLAASAVVLLAGCAVTALPGQSLSVPANARFAVLPLNNATDVPRVERRAQAITVSLLQQKGLRDVVVYPHKPADNPLQAESAVTSAQALAWAKQQGARYALSGTVTEWRYKTGVDSEPAVGITLQVTDVPTGEVVWSASGGRSGWGYQALAAVGQSQIEALLRGIRVTAAAAKPVAKP
ncbi:MAG: penicillin-binding protein activator LpoB [Thiomonas sp.]|uniref:penicillin-binding protein activator LpoB n=1 Tax=Thiomonas sp. TaxID=2047785 RepID=UPI002A36F067|nr:penicillin-binding protein activator LpoB [Thiomonas sp.]MDY0328968.1 penicillin-binding protein activator LpoB [Thiomonas sp.]